MKNIFRTFSDFIIILLITFLTLVSLEYFFRFFVSKYKSSNISEKANNLVKSFDNKYSLEEIYQITNLTTPKFIYKPWVQLGIKDHKNEYSESKDSLRKTTQPLKNDISNCSIKKTVWFFGGSTTYGYGIPWEDTIPSKIVDIGLENKTCIFAKNFGIPTFYSLQEAIYFSSELAKSKINKPDIVIFIDGLNDFAQPKTSINQEPHLTPALKSSFNPNDDKRNDFPIEIKFKNNISLIDYISSKLRTNINNNIYRENYKLPEKYNEEKVALEIANKIIENNSFVSKLCDIYEINCYQFIQPISSIKYNPLEEEKITQNFWKNNENIAYRYKIGYKELAKLIQINKFNSLKIVDISDVFINYKNGIPYVDSGHYSPRGSKNIAMKIYETINKDF